MKSKYFDNDDNVEAYNKEEGIDKFKSMVTSQASYYGKKRIYITIRKINTKHRL